MIVIPNLFGKHVHRTSQIKIVIKAYRSIKAMKKKLKIKSEFSFNHVSSETIKRIINECV